MKRILFLLLFLNVSTLPEPITGALTAARVFFSSPAGAAIGSSIIRSLGAITTCIAGWFVDKKMQSSHKKAVTSNQPATKQELSLNHEFVLHEPITIKEIQKDVRQQNSVEKQEETCCTDCAQETTTECYAKKKSKHVTSQASEGSIQKQNTSQDQPPEDDPCPPLEERKRLVRDWALERKFNRTNDIPFKNKEMPVYQRGRTYVTVDKDCHGGSIMKMFYGKKNNIQRIGSFDKDFNKLRE